MNAPELTSLVKLDSVRYAELVGRRLEDTTDETGSVVESDPEIHLFLRTLPLAVEVRARIEVTFPDSFVLVDAIATFTLEEEVDIAEDVQQEFMKHPGMTVLYPYLRSAAHDITLRLGIPPVVLPLFATEASGVRT